MSDTSQNSASAPVAAPKAPAGAPNPVVRTSTIITNPTAPVDPDAPPVEAKPSELPQSTIDEMNAGKKALERNRPVAQALEAAREAKPA